jgi:hypothetical protein
MFLSADEVRVLTGRTRPAFQVRQLEHLGIPYKRRTDGTLVVLRAHLEHLREPPRREPQLRSA